MAANWSSSNKLALICSLPSEYFSVEVLLSGSGCSAPERSLALTFLLLQCIAFVIVSSQFTSQKLKQT